MLMKQIYNINHKMQILVNIPENFKSKGKVLIILDDSVDKSIEKMELMKSAQNDPLFQSDIEDILEDFKVIDAESL
jgi:hypothetical protein